MKKLIAVAVLAAFSSLPYAAEKDITTDQDGRTRN